MQGTALWYVGPGRAELRAEEIAAPSPGEVRVRARFGAISRGTERLVQAGRVPASEYDRMRAPFMGGCVSVPGQIWLCHRRAESRTDRLNCRAARSSALHPHQSLFNRCRSKPCLPMPAKVPPRRAVLAANMETALNAVWDGGPGPRRSHRDRGRRTASACWLPICARGCRAPT